MGIQESKIKVTIDPNANVGENFIVEVEEEDSVECLKMKIFKKLNIDPDRQRLMYEEQLMMDEKTLAFYNIHEGSIIQLSIKPTESGNVQEI